jgi:hypothetical protein
VIINISMFMSVQGLPSLAKAREFKLELLFRVLEYEHTRATLSYDTKRFITLLLRTDWY